MDVYVNVKQIGKRTDVVEKQIFTFEKKPENIKELITETVRTCVNEHNIYVERNEVKVLSDDEIKTAASIGKIAFGLSATGKKADYQKAVKNALQYFEDGVFRIFIDDASYEKFDDRIDLKNDSVITFIKMTMVIGGIW